MDEKEITQIMQMPMPKLAELAQSQKELTTILSIAIQLGIGIGRQQAHRWYRQMFAGYNETSICN